MDGSAVVGVRVVESALARRNGDVHHDHGAIFQDDMMMRFLLDGHGSCLGRRANRQRQHSNRAATLHEILPLAGRIWMC
jgi:hypothetical protein